MVIHPLKRRPHRARPEQRFLGELSLTLARTHEFCGNSRRTLAMMLAGAMQGPVFWILPGWSPERPHPEGMLDFANPGRFTFVGPGRGEDILWCMEEALRSGAVPLVVAELPMPARLTPVRRLHLAAETGADEGTHRPLGVLLTAGDGGSMGVESRWRMDAAHAGTGKARNGVETTGWALHRTRGRSDPMKSWHVAPKAGGFALGRPRAQERDLEIITKK